LLGRRALGGGWQTPAMTKVLAMWSPILLALVAAVSSPLPTAPAHVFPSSMAHAVDAMGMRVMDAGQSPGMAIAVIEDGRIVYARGFGVAQIGRHVRFDPETQTYIGGVSESLTAAALLLLQQDGKLKLDDKVTQFIPTLTIASDVTLAELLQHTSGLPDCTRMVGFADQTRSVKSDDLLAALNKLTPPIGPGTRFQRNICNYWLAGLVVERASGIPLSDYLQQHIFMPLVMNQTFYAGDSGISPTHAYGYTGQRRHFIMARPWDPAWLSGGAGIVTNVYDLAKFDIGFPLLLRVDAERDMFTPSDAAGDEHHGLGWVIDQRDGKRYVWQNGEIPGYHAMNAVLPDDHIAVIVLTNTDSFQGGGVVAPEAVAAQVLDIVLPPASTHVENSVVERAREWLGRLANHEIDRTQLTASFSKYLTDQLVVKENFAALGKPQTLVPISSTVGENGDTVYEFLVRFARDQYHYRITIAKDGKIDGLVLEP
ncbi:MAG: serine hydrolase domain-containing protein, partial [Candidatus Baltobacteraceae bacterium]